MIYLDHNATSPALPDVVDAMLPWLGTPANPSSAHRFGQAAAAALERARADVAALVGGSPAGVVFTSGATEANHLGLRGAFARGARVFAASALEHPSVRGALAALRAQGATVHDLAVAADGRVVPELPPGTDVAVIQAANHETGVLQPVAGAPWRHVDATQAAGRVAWRIDADSVALSAHKLGGPVGIGALVLRDKAPFPAQLTGGPQERGRRAGTPNVAAAVGFGVACRLALAERDERIARWAAQSARIDAAIRALGGRVAGSAPRVPNTTFAVLPGLEGETLVQALDLAGFALSAGAACATGSLEPSAALRAMGDPDPSGGLRISLGPRTTDADVDALLGALPGVVARLRDADRLGPL